MPATLRTRTGTSTDTSTSANSKLNTLTRDDLLILLESIGVILPAQTKISTEDLTKKLTVALEAAQDLPGLLKPSDSSPQSDPDPNPDSSSSSSSNDPAHLLSPPSLPAWPSTEDIGWAAAQIPMRTATLAQTKIQQNRPLNFISTDKRDTFQELRQIPLAFANHWKAGHRHFCLLDGKGRYGVYVRLISAHQIAHKPFSKPLFILLYKELFSTPSKPFTDLLPSLTQAAGMMTIITTDMERIAMVKLFEQNAAKHLPADFKPKAYSKKEEKRTGLKVSFVLPLVPPDMRVLGRLSDNAGCEVCGSRKISRCMECMTVAYCGPVCQKADWKNHKPTCKSLSGGTWSPVHIDDQPPFMMTYEHMPALAERFLSGTLDLTNLSPSAASDALKPFLPLDYIPEDINTRHNRSHNLHFLVKIQPTLSEQGENRTMLIYDKHRTFSVMWFRGSDRKLFDMVAGLPDETKKIYRWARRVGDRDLEVCFDRPPVPTPVW